MKVNPWIAGLSDMLDLSLSVYILMYASEADEPGCDKRGPGSGLKCDKAHPPYCAVWTRRLLGFFLQRRTLALSLVLSGWSRHDNVRSVPLCHTTSQDQVPSQQVDCKPSSACLLQSGADLSAIA